MKNWFKKLIYKIEQWISDKYGNDELNMFLMCFGIGFAILAFFPAFKHLVVFSFITILWAGFRFLSTDYNRRNSELEIYFRIKDKTNEFLELAEEIWHNRKTHRYFICMKCKSVIRVERGLGDVEVVCPNCEHKMTKHT